MKVYQNDVCTHSVSCRTWSGIASCQNSRDATCCVRESMRLRVKPARTRTYYMHPHARKRTMFKLSFPEKRWMDSNDKPKVGWMLLYGKCCLVTCYPPVFSMHHFSFQTEQSIHAPPFPIRIAPTRSAHPLKALKGRADSAWPLPPSLFLFFSLSKDYIGRIYTYIYTRARYTQS